MTSELQKHTTEQVLWWANALKSEKQVGSINGSLVIQMLEAYAAMLADRPAEKTRKPLEDFTAVAEWATHGDCTCPSGDGSLRHPCPMHSSTSAAALTTERHSFYTGICVSLACVLGQDNGVLWREIVGTVGTDDLLQYAAHVVPDEWKLAGFERYAKSELGRGKPSKLAASPAHQASAQSAVRLNPVELLDKKLAKCVAPEACPRDVDVLIDALNCTLREHGFEVVPVEENTDHAESAAQGVDAAPKLDLHGMAVEADDDDANGVCVAFPEDEDDTRLDALMDKLLSIPGMPTYLTADFDGWGIVMRFETEEEARTAIDVLLAKRDGGEG